MRTLIRNGRAALPDRVENADVLVEDGRISAVGQLGTVTADRTIDAAGCYVLPGMIDFHTHVDDQIGRFYLADTYESGTRVALRNGITTLCTFVTQGAGSLAQAMAAARAKAEGNCHCDVLWHLTPTTFEPSDLANLETLLAAGYRTIKLYTTYKPAGIFASYERIEALFKRLGPLGARFMIHCEDDEVIASVNPAGVDLSRAFSHTLLRPEAAEVVAIRRVLDLALAHRAALHVVHVSTLEGAELLVAARSKGDISFETCPQYLVLDDSWLARTDGHRWLCSPPLRASGRPAMRELVRRGGADILATDHCAFRPQDKDDWDGSDFRVVPNGLAGIGALPQVSWKIWEDDPDRAALGLATHLALNPARRAGLQQCKGALRPGLDADIVVLDPSGPEVPLRSTLVPAFESFPFRSQLAFRHVLLRGEPRVEQGRLLGPDQPLGLPLQPSTASLSLT
jgi:dihydropyrimidinase